MNSFLFVMRRPPHSGVRLAESLDALLTAAAFDQRVAVLWLDDGVLQLLAQQQPESLALKDTSAIFTALELYEVTELYLERESLQERGLVPEDLILPVRLIGRREINALIGGFATAVPD
ncbi:sulfurtransferase complex subunit TusC [Methylomonas sp. DH-1]|uniref:sulfurtransferase complex subunit TusC n=1 Tax=Methylomonas sp. (strain DH-1) TaxID=1727196 RepID=UPI0007C929A9|nr:sulfurtransferase complex subunit TusC [Methylomonas sp. DH-1]ANE55176.1 sulfur relay protein TusC [Methylomonas sp. DH-1]